MIKDYERESKYYANLREGSSSAASDPGEANTEVRLGVVRSKSISESRSGRSGLR